MERSATRLHINIKDITQSVTVANTPTARMMYYFNCVMNAIQIEDATLNQYTKYENHQSLSLFGKKYLLVICHTFSPDVLMEAGLFRLVDKLPDNMSNKFYDISQQQLTLAAAEGMVIGGYSVKASRIMMFEKVWLERNYLIPMLGLVEEIDIQDKAEKQRLAKKQTQTCNIL